MTLHINYICIQKYRYTQLSIITEYFSLYLFSSPIHENRRKFNIRGKKKPHPLVLTKAENIAGYEKFTLDEVIYPDEDKKEAETVSNKVQHKMKTT